MVFCCLLSVSSRLLSRDSRSAAKEGKQRELPIGHRECFSQSCWSSCKEIESSRKSYRCMDTCRKLESGVSRREGLLQRKVFCLSGRPVQEQNRAMRPVRHETPRENRCHGKRQLAVVKPRKEGSRHGKQYPDDCGILRHKPKSEMMREEGVRKASDGIYGSCGNSVRLLFIASFLFCQ